MTGISYEKLSSACLSVIYTGASFVYFIVAPEASAFNP